jgi:UDP-perosamine 4-acetyltransferase
MAGPVLIYGAGGHGRAIIELLRATPGAAIAGLVDAAPPAAPMLGVPVLGDEAALPGLRAAGIAAAVVAVGDPAARRAIAARLAALGFALPVLVHPAALVAPSAALAEGSVVLPRAVIGAAARIGRLCIINTGAIVEHDAVLGEAVHIGPGAVLPGGVEVGDAALLGAGAACRPYVRIGAGAVIGVGAAVITDVPAGARMAGVPARPLEAGVA